MNLTALVPRLTRGFCLLYLGACLGVASGADKPMDPAPLAGIPVYLMEYHIWWGTPFSGPEEHRFWAKWTEVGLRDPNYSSGPSWRRNIGSGAMPLIGPYNSSDEGVIQWQLRCIKAAGFTAVEVQMFANPQNGLSFGREDTFAKIVRIAGEIGMPVFLHDEVMFRKPPATRPAVMASRVAKFINKYGPLPGFYKIKGQPVVAFQYWSRFMTADELKSMMDSVNGQVRGGVHFMVNTDPAPDVCRNDDIGSIVAMANSNFMHHEDHAAELDWTGLEQRLANVREARRAAPKKLFGLWAYGGFDNAGQGRGKGESAWLSRGDNLSVLRQVLTRYAAEKPDFIMVSSWNDWQENTALEPALDVDGYNGDPYQAVETVAALQGKTFTPPPLPPFASMDPWMSAYHKGPDHTPPRIDNLWLEPYAGAVKFDLIDETSPVAGAEVAREPAVSIAWPAGKMAAKGLVIADAVPGVEQLGRFGRPLPGRFDFSLLNGAGSFKPEEPVWLAVSYWDAAPGSIQIEYPFQAKPIYEPVDGYLIEHTLSITLTGEQRWKSKVFLLDYFAISPKSDGLHLRTDAKNVLLGEVAFFRQRDFQTDNIVDMGGTSDRECVTYLARHLPWDPSLVALSLVTGEDGHGNRSFPVALDVGQNREPYMLRLEQEH